MTKPYALYQSSICLFPMRKTKTGELEVLLQRRGKKCSFAPNMWEAGVAGHIDDGENSIDAVLHETEEEIGLKLNAKDLIFNTVVEKYVGDKKLTACFIFAYTVFKWKGVEKIGEPEKCEELKWFNVKKLPKDMIDDRKMMLKAILAKNTHFLANWENRK